MIGAPSGMSFLFKSLGIDPAKMELEVRAFVEQILREQRDIRAALERIEKNQQELAEMLASQRGAPYHTLDGADTIAPCNFAEAAE